jgi:hypothetical protein
MSDLYDTDVLEWSEHQAGLLRRVAAGERVNSDDLDWPNIIEEIESVGTEQRHAVASLLVQALAHSVPRTRGDGPKAAEAAAAPLRCSPHARGWTWQAAVEAERTEVFPARAGMDRG